MLRATEKLFWLKFAKEFFPLWGFFYFVSLTFWTVRYYFGFGTVRADVVLVTSLVFFPLIFSYSFSFALWSALRGIRPEKVEIFSKSRWRVFARHVFLGALLGSSLNSFFTFHVSPKAYFWILGNVERLLSVRNVGDYKAIFLGDKIFIAKYVEISDGINLRDGFFITEKGVVEFSHLTVKPDIRVGAFVTNKELYELVGEKREFAFLLAMSVSTLACVPGFFRVWGAVCVPALNMFEKLAHSFVRDTQKLLMIYAFLFALPSLLCLALSFFPANLFKHKGECG